MIRIIDYYDCRYCNEMDLTIHKAVEKHEQTATLERDIVVFIDAGPSVFGHFVNEIAMCPGSSLIVLY